MYCFACKVLSTKTTAFVIGFSDWKHSDRITEHDKSLKHITNMLALLQRCKAIGTVDASLVRQLEGESKYWKEVLRRVVSVIKFLSERGLPFRGDDELLGSAHDGNYLGILELISQFPEIWSEG